MDSHSTYIESQTWSYDKYALISYTSASKGDVDRRRRRCCQKGQVQKAIRAGQVLDANNRAWVEIHVQQTSPNEPGNFHAKEGSGCCHSHLLDFRRARKRTAPYYPSRIWHLQSRTRESERTPSLTASNVGRETEQV